MVCADPVTKDRIVAVQKNVTSLSVYAKAYDPKPQGKILAKDVAFPLGVLDVDGDFLKVRLSDKEVWLDGAEVTVEKPVEYACVKESRKPAKTASIQGASTGCK